MLFLFYYFLGTKFTRHGGLYMSDHNHDEYQHLVNRFWHNYLSVLEKFSFLVKVRPWYRKHVEEYISAHQGVKIKQSFEKFMTLLKLPSRQVFGLFK